MKSLIIIPFLFLIVIPSVSAQKEGSLIRKGNKQYEEGKFKEAEIDYRKAMEISPKTVKGEFNLGNSQYKQQNWEEASQSYANSAGKMKPDDLAGKAAAYYNLGNTLFKAEKYRESVEAYKQSLRMNPEDNDTRYNLSYALKKMSQQQQQQQKKDNQKDDNKDNKDQPQQNQPQDKQNEPQDKQQQKQQISKQDAERMLQALKNDEQKTLDKVKKQKVKPVQIQIEKDW